MTARDVIATSLRLIGVLAPGENIAATEASDGLAALNRMLDSWSNERLNAHARLREVFDLVVGTAAYTMGTDGDFDSARPQRIEAASIMVSDIEYPLTILTREEWQKIPDKTSQTEIPTKLYIEGTYPKETLTFWPVPSVAYEVVTYSWKPLSTLAVLGTEVSFPPGYEDAIIQNLAIRLAPEYRKAVSPVLGALALESKANIKRMNYRPDLLRVDSALISGAGGFDVGNGGGIGPGDSEEEEEEEEGEEEGGGDSGGDGGGSGGGGGEDIDDPGDDVIEIATTPLRPMPQVHENWTPTYTDVLSYKMAPGEIVPLWFRVRSGDPVTLELGGADAAKFEVTFYKPFGQSAGTSNAYQRASLGTSPYGVYYDPLNPIPSGVDNFTPEVADTYEFIYCALTCKSDTAGDQDCALEFNLGDDTVTATIHVWDNITLPDAPTIQLAIASLGAYAGDGTQGGYTTDAHQATAVSNASDLLIDFRMTPYGSPTSFLAVSGPTFNIDQNSGSGGSFQQQILDKLGSGHHKFWFCDPMGTSGHRTLAYAQAAEATLVAEGLTNMWVYIWDEPGAGVAATLKSTLDHWSAGSPSTKILLTTTLDYDNGNPSGLDFSTYPNLVLVPVIQQIGGSYPAISAYGNDKAGFYTSCQGNCGPRLNTNTTTGDDEDVVDLAYIDLPMVRRYAAYMLAERTGWRTKIETMLHYNSMESWTDYNGNAALAQQNPWLSARRFNVMGDGTLIYPAIQGYKPHTGLATFSASSLDAVPSIRLLYLTHASFMADLVELYRVSSGTNLADTLVTDSDTFVTDYATYETARETAGDALEAA